MYLVSLFMSTPFYYAVFIPEEASSGIFIL